MTDSTPATVQYGVRFYDGSVSHPWNGRTQEQRARERLAELRATYPRDAAAGRFTLVIRDGNDQRWREADAPFPDGWPTVPSFTVTREGRVILAAPLMDERQSFDVGPYKVWVTR